MEYLLTIPGRLNNLNDFIRADKASRYKGGELKAKNEDIVAIYIRKCLRGVKIHKKVYMEYLWVEKNKKRDLDNISSFGRKVIQDTEAYSFMHWKRSYCASWQYKVHSQQKYFRSNA